MRDKDLYAQILGIKSPWQVSNVELALSKGEVMVHVEQEEGAAQRCPTCGEIAPGYPLVDVSLLTPRYLHISDIDNQRSSISTIRQDPREQ